MTLILPYTFRPCILTSFLTARACTGRPLSPGVLKKIVSPLFILFTFLQGNLILSTRISLKKYQLYFDLLCPKKSCYALTVRGCTGRPRLRPPTGRPRFRPPTGRPRSRPPSCRTCYPRTRSSSSPGWSPSKSAPPTICA